MSVQYMSVGIWDRERHCGSTAIFYVCRLRAQCPPHPLSKVTTSGILKDEW
jgi:hypothetical protein